MGVRGLQSYIRQYGTQKSFADLMSPANKHLRIGIDVSYYFYRWQGDADRILKFIRDLESNGHHVLLAFDGRAEDGKVWEAQRRRDVRDQEMKSANAIQVLLDTEILSEDERSMLELQYADHQRKGWTLTKDTRNMLKERLYGERIPIVKAKGEADGLLAAASNVGDLHIVISGDMDLLAMGAQSLWTPLEDGLQFREYNRETILTELRLDNWQFRSMCAMCFTETSLEQNKFSIQQAHQMLRVFRSLTVLKQKYPDWLTVWPDDSHIFYRSVDAVGPWIREDQVEIYKAFMDGEPMPYV